MKPIGPCCGIPTPKAPCPAPPPTGRFLMQRILASGKIHRRCQCYALCPDSFPCDGHPPYTLVDAALSASPLWQEIPCHERNALLLQIRLPLALKVRDNAGCISIIHTEIAEQLRLHCAISESECWRGQIYVQGAVRPCGCAQFCPPGPVDARLEVMLEGFLLVSCPMGVPPQQACPQHKPWYPQPRFDPWNDSY